MKPRIVKSGRWYFCGNVRSGRAPHEAPLVFIDTIRWAAGDSPLAAFDAWRRRVESLPAGMR